ncbi:hypothetical protein ACJMK2_009443 [Sinanodonta woodiana]|uniref:TIR domain-containing protein n=1 Tax=Sinanodonta woodiana TaxID=1069815 RepID=A0ABD3VC89_SINWO
MGSGPSSSIKGKKSHLQVTGPNLVKDTSIVKPNRGTKLVPVTLRSGNRKRQKYRPRSDSGSEGYGSEDSSSVTSLTDFASHRENMPEPKSNQRHSPLRTISTIHSENDEALIRANPELITVLKSFDECVALLDQKNKWRQDHNEAYFKNVNKTLKQNVLANFQEIGLPEKRQVMGNHLVNKGFPKLLFDFYECVIEEADIQAFDNRLAQEAFDGDDILKVLVTLREIFWNFTDSCPAFSKAVSETGLFGYLVNDLSAIKEDGLNALEDDDRRFAFNSAVAILHNCAHNPDTERSIYRSVNAVDSLLPFLESKQPQIQMVTLLALADMIDDNECDKIQGSENVFQFLIDMIKAAHEAPDRRKEGFHASELIDGLSGLAKVEKNKTLIMDTTPLGIFRQILEDGHEKELASVCRAVRELAFNQTNIGIIKKEDVLCRKLLELRAHKSREVSLIAQGAVFQLKLDVSTPTSTPRDLPPIPDEDTQGASDASKGVAHKQRRPLPKRLSRGELPWNGQHIMISYNWDNQKEILKIKDRLVDRGYNVWLDLEHMHTYMLDAMAQAVEKAFVVLVCFSEKYKLSQNCRAEAEYAFHKQKEIIPLKMQAGYNPDGWLGILIGSKLYYEFSETFHFDEKVKDLLHAIDKLPNNPKYASGSAVSSQKTLSPVPQEPVSDSPGTVEKWTRDEIDHWLRKHKLDPTRIGKLQSLTGEKLVFLKKMSTKAPDFFFRCLENKLGLDSLEDIVNMSNALEHLMVR